MKQNYIIEFMPRKIAYSLADVFEHAMPLILEKGFRGCSMETLINKTDFNRRAFYIEFQNKVGFTHALLHYYIDKELTPLQDMLTANTQIPQAIIAYFEAYQEKINHKGCLLVKLVLELAHDDPIIQDIARRYYDNLQLAFIACLERAIAHHELPNDINVEAFALKLSCFAQGFAVSNSIQQGDSDAITVIKNLFAKNA